jgi:hypothetical protein
MEVGASKVINTLTTATEPTETPPYTIILLTQKDFSYLQTKQSYFMKGGLNRELEGET